MYLKSDVLLIHHVNKYIKIYKYIYIQIMNNNIASLINLYFLTETNKLPNISKDELKKLLNSFIIYHGCSLCEKDNKYLNKIYPNCPTIYNFHHIDPKTKKAEVTSFFSNGHNNDLLREMKKCIILCKNCHEYVDNNLEIGKNIKPCYDDFIYYLQNNILNNGLFMNDSNANPYYIDQAANNIIKNAQNLINRSTKI